MSVLLVVVFLIFAIQPTLVQIFKLRTEVATSEKTLAQLLKKTKTLTQIESTWTDIETQIPYLDSAMPYGPDYRIFAKELVVMARMSGVTVFGSSLGESLVFIQGISPYTPSKGMENVELPFSIRVGGNYAQIMDFWKQLISTDRIAQINSVTIAPETLVSKDKAVPLTMSLSGSIYYLGDVVQLSPLIKTSKKDK
jgi:Tfp pilus assembly protein PilO